MSIGGISTRSMMWITPLVALMSALVTVASLTIRRPRRPFVTWSVPPCTVGGEVGLVIAMASEAMMLAGMTW